MHVLDVNAAPVEAGPVEAVPGHGDQLRIPLPAEPARRRLHGELARGLRGGRARDRGRVQLRGQRGAGHGRHAERPRADDAIAVRRAASPASSCCTWGSRCRSPPPSWVCSRSAGRVPERKRVLRFAAASAVVGVVTMLLSERATLGVSMGDLLSSATGTDYLWLLGGVTFAAVAALDAARRSDRTSLVVAGVAAAAAMLIRAIGGHAAAAATPALQIGLQWLHFMAASVWMGGLALTFLVAPGAAPDRGKRPGRRGPGVLVPGRLRAGRRARHRRVPRDAGGRRPVEAVRSVPRLVRDDARRQGARSSWC